MTDVTGRPPTTRRALRLAVAVLSVVALTACGGPRTGVGAAGDEVEVSVPEYYPDDYDAIIEGSKQEGGRLNIYSNTDQENWAPILRDFQAKYPWVEEINANNLDSDEVFQRVLSEQATGDSPADLLVSNAAQGWAGFAGSDGALTAYESPELEQLPEFARPMPDTFTMSTDPVTISFNTSLLEQEPTGVADLAGIVRADPGTFREKITTRDVEGSFGFTVAYAYVNGRDDPESAWAALEQILPLARPETSSGTQIEKITAGEYLAGFFISGAVAFPAEERSGGLFKTVFPDDGTPVLPRAVGIAGGAPHPNTAKLFVDFLLSHDGQAAVAEGGLTAYRDDVKGGDGQRTYADLVEAVGEENVIFAEYKPIPEAEVEEFTNRWTELLGR